MIQKNFVAPALPLANPQYDVRQQGDVLRALRLYFNLLDSYFATTILDALNGGAGGNGISFPHIAASDTGNQVASGDNTPTLVTWDTLDSGYLWTLNPSGTATCQVAGVYTIRYSLQFINTANAVHDASVWLQVDGTNVPRSTTNFSIPARKSTGDPSYVCGYSEATFSVAVGEEIGLYWATDLAGNPTTPTDGVYIYSDSAQTSPYARPSIPSAIGSITYVSALP